MARAVGAIGPDLPRTAPTRTLPGASSAAASTADALPSATRLYAALVGLGLGVLAVTAATLLALLIVTGPFHTSLGSLA